MNDNVLEVGRKVFISSMTVEEVRFMVSWDKHEEDIYQDYNFPNLSNVEQIRWYKDKTSGNQRLFSIYNFQKKHIGYMSLRNVHKLFKNSELGIVINPKYINRGYGSDAIYTLLRWYFLKLKYKKIYLTVALYNKRAMKVYKKLGFRYYKEVYEEYDNLYFFPFSKENIQKYSGYFKRKNNKTYSICMKMVLTSSDFFKINKE